MRGVTVEERFWPKVEFGDWLDCWHWKAGRTSEEYGAFWVDGKTVAAHRVAYTLLVGPEREGLQLDHTCHNDAPSCRGGRSCMHRRCVNPLHLELVSPKENLLRSLHTKAGANAAKTHCPQGHAYEGDNLLISSQGGRGCRECHRLKLRRLRASR